MFKSIVRLCGVLGSLLPFAPAQSNQAQYVISTVAGVYTIGDDGPATASLLNYPASAVYDKKGNLFVADSYNYRIRKINPAGVISTFVGTWMPWATCIFPS